MKFPSYEQDKNPTNVTGVVTLVHVELVLTGDPVAIQRFEP
jgi:hypothetical protein